jgi:hydroxyacylglutathione hydrolase
MAQRHQEILSGLFFIQRGYLNANHFAYRGNKPVLIDTGYLGDWPLTESLLSKLGDEKMRGRENVFR